MNSTLRSIMQQPHAIRETFVPRISPYWRRTQIGGGRMSVQPSGLRLLLAQQGGQGYANAMLDDYGASPTRPRALARHDYRWRPPLRLTVRARVSGSLSGTAGFGFWNNPLAPLNEGGIALPSALWFFHAAPPSNMPLAQGVPGHGWKAACIDATQPSALAWAPLAPFVLLLNRHPHLYRRIWPRVQRALRIAETPFAMPTSVWRTYTIEWLPHVARLLIDDNCVLETDRPPRGPLGFVAWLDNQWAIVTPTGNFGWGVSDASAQWLDLAALEIISL